LQIYQACYHKRSGEKFALKVLRDSARSRREIELHWLACRQTNVVSIVDIFENTFEGLNCLLVVVEFMQGGDLLTLFEANGRVPYSEQCLPSVWGHKRKRPLAPLAVPTNRRCPDCPPNWLRRAVPP